MSSPASTQPASPAPDQPPCKSATAISPSAPTSRVSRPYSPSTPCPRGDGITLPSPTTPGQTSPEDFTGLDWWTHGQLVNYDQPNPAEGEISQWLIANPQRVNPGRVGFVFSEDGWKGEVRDVSEEKINGQVPGAGSLFGDFDV